jgi:hypothetical protein
LGADWGGVKGHADSHLTFSQFEVSKRLLERRAKALRPTFRVVRHNPSLPIFLVMSKKSLNAGRLANGNKIAGAVGVLDLRDEAQIGACEPNTHAALDVELAFSRQQQLGTFGMDLFGPACCSRISVQHGDVTFVNDFGFSRNEDSNMSF